MYTYTCAIHNDAFRSATVKYHGILRVKKMKLNWLFGVFGQKEISKLKSRAIAVKPNYDKTNNHLSWVKVFQRAKKSMMTHGANFKFSLLSIYFESEFKRLKYGN